MTAARLGVVLASAIAVTAQSLKVANNCAEDVYVEVTTSAGTAGGSTNVALGSKLDLFPSLGWTGTLDFGASCVIHRVRIEPIS
jgi:hypothetical protein